jgi:hypothetical protein
MTGKRREGVLYEDKVQAHFTSLFGKAYIPSPWFTFWSAAETKARFCQPDGLLFDPLGKTIWIVEAKLKHTSDAWWQLRYLYTPVIAAIFSPQIWEIRVCEVVRWYDPAVTFPERVALVPQILAVQPNEFGVHIWKP